MILLLRSPSHPLSFRRFCCWSSAAETARYREAFSRRMAMAGVKPYHHIALGVSGGPDSMALCILTAGWKSDSLIRRNADSGCIDGLLGIIVDHKLRHGSTEEANQVRQRVSRMGIKCEIVSCDWSDGRPKQGHLQEAAREKRYQIFQGVCIGHHIGVLLVAHHADDQAELFILRLSRNSGVLGLAGMAFVSQLFPTCTSYFGKDSGNRGVLLVRPMLEFSKDDMYKICQGGHQEWVEDPTNQNQLFVRNRIRRSLGNLSSCVFRSEVQNLISACRLTRSYIQSICHQMITQSVTIMDHGYAIIDLEKLKASTVEDICLSKFLALILQFISQKHRPLRGSVSQLLLDYVRNFPCKTSLTAAACYLCAAPRSRGTKILVCCSLDSPQLSRMCFSVNFSSVVAQPILPGEIDEIIKEAKSYSDELAQNCSNVPFLFVKSSEAILNLGKKLNLISESTYERIRLLGQEESMNFITKTEHGHGSGSRHELKNSGASSIPLHAGEVCHFMSRFLVTWKHGEDVKNICCSGLTVETSEENQKHCQFCMIDQDRSVAVRHMIDDDWLYLASLLTCHMPADSEGHADVSIKSEKNAAMDMQCSRYMRISAQKALQALKSIPVSVRRTLPVLVNTHGSPVSIPSICFNSCPNLSAVAVFKPRVPLEGGYSSYI